MIPGPAPATEPIAHVSTCGITYALGGFWWSFWRVYPPGELEALQRKYNPWLR